MKFLLNLGHVLNSMTPVLVEKRRGKLRYRDARKKEGEVKTGVGVSPSQGQDRQEPTETGSKDSPLELRKGT